MDGPTSLLTGMSRRKLMVMSGLGTAAVSIRPDAVLAKAVIGGPVANVGNVTELRWPMRGSFGGKAVIGPHQPSAAAMLDQKPVLGLPLERTFFYGNLRDDEGNLYEVVRGIAAKGVAGANALFIQSSRGKETLRAMPEWGNAAATSNGAEGRLIGGEAVWTSAPDAPGKAFRFSMSEDGNSASWKEDGLLDLSGKLLGPGLQWHIPDSAGSELYVSQIYEMNGIIDGRRVHGILALDQAYLPRETPMYGGKDPLFRPDMHHRCWYTWGTRYTDGSYDCGHFVLGTDRVGFALLTNERGSLVLDTDVAGDIELVPNEIWPKRITVKTRGETWVFTPDPKGRMPDMLHGANQAWTPQTEGQWRKIGDSRKPAIWFAWGEVQPADRVGYTQNSRL